MMESIKPFAPRVRIAYASMEIAILSEIRGHAGGPGVLSGDTDRARADPAPPVVLARFMRPQGRLKQTIGPDGDRP